MIEQMTHVAVVGKAADRKAVLSWLYREHAFHAMPIKEGEGESAWSEAFATLPDDTQAMDTELNRIHGVVAFCAEHCSDKPGFLDLMFPLKVVGTKEEIAAAIASVSVDGLSEQAARLRSAIDGTNETLARLKGRRDNIKQFAFLGDDLPAVARLRHSVFEVVAVTGQGGKAFLLDERIADGRVVAEELFAEQLHTYYGLAAAASDEQVLRDLVAEHGLQQHPVPQVDRSAGEELDSLERQIRQADAMLNTHRNEANRFADLWHKKAGLVAGHYESERILAQHRMGMAESSHLFAARGYVKTEALEPFRRRLEEKIPSAGVVECPAPEGEEPPISLKWNKWISPGALLVKMYGLPSYKAIDPTPFVCCVFFLFAGICLGDAVYGLALIAIATWLKKRYREQEHLQDFFQCFAYVGAAAVLIGTLTGSWMGNLTSKLPGMKWFYNLTQTVSLIDPVNSAQMALYIAIGIGVFTQLFGLAIRIHKCLRQGDRMGAFSDGFLWMAFLVFLLGAALCPVVWLSRVFWVLFGLACVGLVLTQGREQKGWFSRIALGTVSLYGIAGSYGASSMLGDLLSYARLMALCLTGAALGSTFNMLAGLGTEIPVVGLFVAIAVVIGGHSMNFFLNLLSGFIHSARLIMLEFFGRFYEAGGAPYKPYGFDSPSVGVKRN